MLSRSLNQLLRLFLESPCPLCQRSTSGEFCVDCERQIHSCQLLGSEVWQEESLPVLAWGAYQGALKQAIAALKYHNHPQLARPLGQAMADLWQGRNAVPHDAVVVPIPMHPNKQQTRGFNQAELLANHFCAVTRLPLHLGLERIRETEAQFRVSGFDRQRNLKEAFAIAPRFLQSPPAQPVWLLDDIYTSGATARSAAQTLQQSGIRVGGIVVLARAGGT